ncbi:hypothetical protein CPB86DRAFT_96353 [Serendipita vermifera]|nr:hypothetical protein CPB86DRAFT_96353 [Serendipita vermifera]
MSTLAWIEEHGLEDPSIQEFLRRPDLRQVDTFFLGILFASALYYFVHSPTLASIVSRLSIKKSPTQSSVINLDVDASYGSTVTSIYGQLDPLALVFILDLVYITTAATQFGSLLAFSSTTGAVSCTFLVAWGALGAETIRLIGLFKLTIHLRELGGPFWERIALWAALMALTIVMFLTTAVSTGVLRAIPQVVSMSFCYFRHFKLGAGMTAAMNLSLELYILTRFIRLSFKWATSLGDKKMVAKDTRIYRALSLLILDLATIYPSLFPVSLAADFVPFAVASVGVLIAFNHSPLPKQSLVSSVLNIGPSSLPQSIRIPTPSFSPFLQMQSTLSSMKERSIAEFPAETASIHTTGSRHQKTISHPFAAALAFTTEPRVQPRELREQQGPRPFSLNTLATESRSDSFRNAVVTTASRTRIQASTARETQISKASSGDPDKQSRKSFLPLIKTNARRPERDLPPTPATAPSKSRQILPRQAEVADQMIASPRPGQHTHRTIPSHGSLTLSGVEVLALAGSSGPPTGALTPPALPRAQRMIRQQQQQTPSRSTTMMTGVSEDSEGPLQPPPPLPNTRSSTPDSARVFGSDILIRSREDVMRPPKKSGGEGEHSEDTGVATAGHESDNERERKHKTDISLYSLNAASSSRHSGIGLNAGFGFTSVGDVRSSGQARPRTSESTSDAAHDPPGSGGAQSSRRLLSLSFGEIPSPARRALNALKRPTFGEASFERFKSGLVSATSEQSGSSVGHDHGSDLPSPSSAGGHHRQSISGGRGDERPPPRTLIKAGGSRLRSSTIGERTSDADTKRLRSSSSKRPAT